MAFKDWLGRRSKALGLLLGTAGGGIAGAAIGAAVGFFAIPALAFIGTGASVAAALGGFLNNASSTHKTIALTIGGIAGAIAAVFAGIAAWPIMVGTAGALGALQVLGVGGITTIAGAIGAAIGATGGAKKGLEDSGLPQPVDHEKQRLIEEKKQQKAAEEQAKREEKQRKIAEEKAKYEERVHQERQKIEKQLADQAASAASSKKPQKFKFGGTNNNQAAEPVSTSSSPTSPTAESKRSPLLNSDSDNSDTDDESMLESSSQEKNDGERKAIINGNRVTRINNQDKILEKLQEIQWTPTPSSAAESKKPAIIEVEKQISSKSPRKETFTIDCAKGHFKTHSALKETFVAMLTIFQTAHGKEAIPKITAPSVNAANMWKEAIKAIYGDNRYDNDKLNSIVKCPPAESAEAEKPASPRMRA